MLHLLLVLGTLVLGIVMFLLGNNWAKKRGYQVPSSFGYAATLAVAILVWAYISISKGCR